MPGRPPNRGPTATAVDGTHPTIMHSCLENLWDAIICRLDFAWWDNLPYLKAFTLLQRINCTQKSGKNSSCPVALCTINLLLSQSIHPSLAMKNRPVFVYGSSFPSHNLRVLELKFRISTMILVQVENVPDMHALCYQVIRQEISWLKSGSLSRPCRTGKSGSYHSSQNKELFRRCRRPIS